LLAFREKLTEQLTLIEAAQTKKSGKNFGFSTNVFLSN
jgi:hypothetical protein